MFLLTLRDLQHRAARVATVVLGTALVFTLLYLMTGLAAQFDREPRLAVEGLGAEHWLVRSGATGVFTSAATVDPALAGQVGASGPVEPLVAARHSLREADEPLDIVVIGSVAEGLAAPEIVEGRAPQAAGEVVIDASGGLAVGDAAPIGPRTFEIVGLTEDATLFAGMPLVHMSLADAQELVYRGQDLATALIAGGSLGDVPEGLTALTPDAVAEDALRPLERSIASVNLIRVLLWFVAAMIVGAVVYLSALERRRDFAVLKAVGSPSRGMLASLALQGSVIALAAALVASGLQALITPVFPLAVSVPPTALVQLPILAVVVAIVASVAGMRQVVAADPAAAFAGPGG